MGWSRNDDILDHDSHLMREQEEGALDDLEEKAASQHRSKDRKKSRREEKDRSTKDHETSKASDTLKEREKEAKDLDKDRVHVRERRKEEREEHEKDINKDKIREKDNDRDKYRDKERERVTDRKGRGKEKDGDRERDMEDNERGRDKDRGKEKNRDRDNAKEKEREKGRDRAKDREREREKYKDHEKEKGNEKDRYINEKEKVKEKIRDKEMDAEPDKERYRDKVGRKMRDETHDRSKDDKLKLDGERYRSRDENKQGKGSSFVESSSTTVDHGEHAVGASGGPLPSPAEMEERILKMKEERTKKKSEGISEVLSWANKMRRLEEKRNTQKEKALQLSKILEEQDNIGQGESEDEEATLHATKDLAGVKVLHGLDKVIEGGAVVLTLKDQSILANGDVNEEVDMLENVEIGEQKRRDDAYKAAKKKSGIYDDKFNDHLGSEKKILPQYDDQAPDEGITLDERGRFSGEAEKKLEELRRRIQGVSTSNYTEDLSSSGKISSDYYTHEEMLQFKKPKKKKSLRKKEKLDLDALEAEALSAGLGAGDLGTRNTRETQAIREEKEKSETERRNSAYQSAYAKADEASKALRMEQTLTVQSEEDGSLVFGDEDEDLYRSLEKARKLALKKHDEAMPSGPQAIAALASTTASNQNLESQNAAVGELQENKIIFTEMEEFVSGLQLDDEAQKPTDNDVFMEEDEAPKASDEVREDEGGGWTEVNNTAQDEHPANEEDKEEIIPDETIHEVPMGKGLSGTLKLLKERGSLKESVEWGGRNMDKKKSKLVGIYEDGGEKEIRIERTDEFGRILTPKEAFRIISHKFHGKGPGKMKQEKRMKQYHEELKLKQMKNSDTPSQSVERMREAQARLKTPYLVLSGHVKPGQTSDPLSGFATVEKELPGGLTPMLGDRKVEHFLGIKRKGSELGNSEPPKKPKN